MFRIEQEIEKRRQGGREGNKKRRGQSEAGWWEFGVKYVRRVAGKEILMCVRVWPKQIHWQTSCFE